MVLQPQPVPTVVRSHGAPCYPLCGDGRFYHNLLLQAQLSDAQLIFLKCHEGRDHVCVVMLDIQWALNKHIKNVLHNHIIE